MAETRKLSAQRHVDRIHAFQQELAEVEQAGVMQLDSAQKNALTQYHRELLARYRQEFDVDTNQGARKFNLGMQVASFFGALALAASVFFLFYQYWAQFGMAAQILILVSAPIATLYLAQFLKRAEKSGHFARLAAMVSFSCFVLNIALLGRIFDLPASESAFLVWSAYALMLAYLYLSRVLLAASIACFFAYLAAKVGVWLGLYWLSFGERPENFFLPSLIVFCIPFIPNGRYEIFAPVYRVLSICALMICVLILSFWGDGSYLSWDDSIIEGFYQVLGFIGSAVLVALGIKNGWNEVTNTGSVFFVLFMYTKMWEWMWGWLPHYLFFFLMGLVAVLFLLIFKRLRHYSLQDKEAV